VRAVLQLLQDPYDHSSAADAGGVCKVKEGKEEEEAIGRYKGKPTPEWAADLVCTCSS
jgi:hypothetical protein